MNITNFYSSDHAVRADCYASLLVARQIGLDIIKNYVSKSVILLARVIAKSTTKDVPTCCSITSLNHRIYWPSIVWNFIALPDMASVFPALSRTAVVAPPTPPVIDVNSSTLGPAPTPADPPEAPCPTPRWTPPVAARPSAVVRRPPLTPRHAAPPTKYAILQTPPNAHARNVWARPDMPAAQISLAVHFAPGVHHAAPDPFPAPDRASLFAAPAPATLPTAPDPDSLFAASVAMAPSAALAVPAGHPFPAAGLTAPAPHQFAAAALVALAPHQFRPALPPPAAASWPSAPVTQSPHTPAVPFHSQQWSSGGGVLQQSLQHSLGRHQFATTLSASYFPLAAQPAAAIPIYEGQIILANGPQPPGIPEAVASLQRFCFLGASPFPGRAGYLPPPRTHARSLHGSGYCNSFAGVPNFG